MQAEKKVNIIRRMYDWVLHWGDTPYGAPALFLLAFAESSFFPIPPDVLLIALALSKRQKAFKFALICSFGSVLGGVFGYYFGYFLWYTDAGFSSFANLFFHYIPGFTEEVFNKVQKLYIQYDFWVVFSAGFTPIPFKVITITAGVAKINFAIFIVASLLSRSLRFFLIAAFIRKFGEPIKQIIEKYFNMLAILFTLLLIGGFILIKYVLH